MFAGPRSGPSSSGMFAIAFLPITSVTDLRSANAVSVATVVATSSRIIEPEGISSRAQSVLVLQT